MIRVTVMCVDFEGNKVHDTRLWSREMRDCGCAYTPESIAWHHFTAMKMEGLFDEWAEWTIRAIDETTGEVFEDGADAAEDDKVST